MVPSRTKMKNFRMPIPIDLAGWLCSGRLRRRTPLGVYVWRLLDRMVFGRAHPCFTLTVWFQRERFEALLAVNIMEHAFSFHGAGGE